MKLAGLLKFRHGARIQQDAIRRITFPWRRGRSAVGAGRRDWRAVLTTLLAWAWRLTVGSLLCFNYWVVSFATSVVVMGWTYRWMQGLVLHGWWRRSSLRKQASFAAFCDSLGPKAPVLRPRWFWHERPGLALNGRTTKGCRPGLLRRVVRALGLPWHSLELNFRIGFQALFCTYLLTGLGCLLMVFSWEFGWLNSFHKGYEDRFVGRVLGYSGIALFSLAMIYVPMAQAHQAATGDYRAFLDFGFVRRLIHARLGTYVGLAALITVLSVPLEILKTLPVIFDQGCPIPLREWLEKLSITHELPDWIANLYPGYSACSDAEVRAILRLYLVKCSFVLFPVLLLVRLTTALVYRSAVVRALQLGWIARRDLHPVLSAWLERLDLVPAAPPALSGFRGAVYLGRDWLYRLILYPVLFLIWFSFVAKVYVGEFLNYHPIVGFLNHVLVQFPCFDFFPTHLLNWPTR